MHRRKFILIFGLLLLCGVTLAQADLVTYEREDLAVLTDGGLPLASVELENSYSKVGSDMYLQDCGLTTCYLTLTITTDQPLDARNIIGRVGVGEAEYVGVEVFETRTVPVATYKTVEKNYTFFNNITESEETAFYNETVFDRYVDTPVLGWYSLDYANMDAGKEYTIRLEYHKTDQRETVDLIPEISGKQIDGWAYWVGTEQIPYWTDGTDGVWVNVSLNTTTPLYVIINKSMGSDTGNGSLVFYAFTDCSGTSLDAEWTTHKADPAATITSGANGSYCFAKASSAWGEIIFATDIALENYSALIKGHLNASASNSWIGSHVEGDADAGTWDGIAFAHAIATSPTTATGLREWDGAYGGSYNYDSTDTLPIHTEELWVKTWIIGTNKGGIMWNSTNASLYTYNETAAFTHEESKAGGSFYSGTYAYFDFIAIMPATVNEPTVSCADLSATQVLCNITTTENLTGYQVRIPYSDINDSNITVELAEEIMGNITLNNYTYTTPQYETVAYNYTINFTLSEGSTLNYATFHIHGTDLDGEVCTNVSTTYYCYINNIPAPLTTVNNTAQTAYWKINYTSGANTSEENQSFTPYIYFGMWPADSMSSPFTVIGGLDLDMNFTYGYAEGIMGIVAGTGWYNGQNATASCAAGLCNASVPTSSVMNTDVVQTYANLTLTSSFWSESVTRNMDINTAYYMTALNATMTEYSVTNENNANDSNWGTYATFGLSGGWLVFNYTFSELYDVHTWTVRTPAGYASYTIPEDCWRANVSLKVLRDSTQFKYYCLNYSNNEYSQFNQVTPGSYYFYEQNVTYYKNNSYTRISPYGLTDCSVGEALFNYSSYDEDDKSALSVDYEITYEMVTVAGTTYETFSGSASSWNICFYPDTLEGNVSSIELYGATSYDNIKYYLFDIPIDGTSYELKRYLPQSALAKLTVIKVREYGVGVEDAYIYIQKYFVANGSFETVAMAKTNDEGEAATYLVPIDVFYKFVVFKDGETLFTSATQEVICAESADTCYIYLDIEDTTVDFFTYYEDISGGCAYSNSTGMLVCTYADTSGLMQYAELSCWKTGVVNNTLINYSNLTSASGTLYCNISGNGNGTYTYSFTARYNPEYTLGSGSITLGATNVFGASGLLLAFLAFIVLAFIGVWSPPVGIILGLLALFASWGVGFISGEVGWASLIAIAVSGIILAYKMRA